MSELIGMTFGSALIIVCFRETVLWSDATRLSWVKSGLLAIPFVFVVRGLGSGQDGEFDFAGAVVQAALALMLTFSLWVWMRLYDNKAYERRQRKIPKILGWVWLTLMSAVSLLKLATGLS